MTKKGVTAARLCGLTCDALEPLAEPRGKIPDYPADVPDQTVAGQKNQISRTKIGGVIQNIHLIYLLMIHALYRAEMISSSKIDLVPDGRSIKTAQSPSIQSSTPYISQR